MFSRHKYIIFLSVLLLGGLFVLAGCGGTTNETEVVVNTNTPTPVSEITATTQNIDPTNTPEPTFEPTETPTEVAIEVTPTQQPEDEEETPTLEPTSTPTVEDGETAVEVPDCLEKAAFFSDVTVPDGTLYEHGESFTKIWRFRNEGTCTWTPDYAIVFHSGDIMSAPSEVSFPETTLPGEQIDLSVEMKAPTRGGQYISNWEFENQAGEKFGAGISGQDLFWVLINVSYLDQGGAPQPDPSTLPPPSAPTGCGAQQNSSYESQVVNLVNQYRNLNGVEPLTVNSALAAAAIVHSTDMGCSDFVGHIGSDGSHWRDRISVQGYSASYSTENIFVGFPDFGGTPDGAFDWWINSQVHRDNILDPDVTEFGVGYVFVDNSSYGGYYTIVFARP